MLLVTKKQPAINKIINMKNQTKIATFITLLVMGLSTIVSAQDISFGIRAGVNFQNINGKDIGGDKLENKLKHGFNGGITVEIPVAPEFYVQPGLLFSTKGSKLDKYEYNGTLVETSVARSLSYIELPVNFLFKPALGNGNMLLGFGPYVAYGIGGKDKIDAKVAGFDINKDVDIEFQNKVESGDPVDQVYVRPFDAGANFIIGYETGMGLSAQLNAQLGLLNMLPDVKGIDMKDATQKNTGFGISLGYRF